MSNVLSEEKRQQVVALGRLGWPLRRIEQATGVRPPGAWGRRPPAKPANEVTTGSDAAEPATTINPDLQNLPHKRRSKAETAKPAIQVTTGFGVHLNALERKNPEPIPSSSFCEPFRDAIEGRSPWLVRSYSRTLGQKKGAS